MASACVGHWLEGPRPVLAVGPALLLSWKMTRLSTSNWWRNRRSWSICPFARPGVLQVAPGDSAEPARLGTFWHRPPADEQTKAGTWLAILQDMKPRCQRLSRTQEVQARAWTAKKACRKRAHQMAKKSNGPPGHQCIHIAASPVLGFGGQLVAQEVLLASTATCVCLVSW